MNTYTHTGNVEIDAHVAERIQLLPQELQSVIDDETFFNSIPQLLSQFALDPKTLDLIGYEVFLILIQIEPLEDLFTTLVTEHLIDVKDALDISNILTTQLLANYIHLLKEEGGGETSPITTPRDINPLSNLPNAQTQPVPNLTPTETKKEIPITPYQHTEPVSQPLEQNMYVETNDTAPDLEIPRYQKPLTNIPKYREGE